MIEGLSAKTRCHGADPTTTVLAEQRGKGVLPIWPMVIFSEGPEKRRILVVILPTQKLYFRAFIGRNRLYIVTF